MELEKIKNSIHEIRGKKVILDFDLAKMYQVETRISTPLDALLVNRAESRDTVNRNQNLRTQFATSSWGGQRYNPYAFTEQGVAMLSSVLNSEIAIDINISIMRAFVMIRQFALTYQELNEKLIALEKKHNQKFTDIDQVLNYLIKKDQQVIQQTARKQVGYKK
jgi:hypothetical protein